MHPNFNISTDQNLTNIQNLKGLPWIGRDYLKNDKRLLIIAESQYAQGETKEQYEKDLALVNV